MKAYDTSIVLGQCNEWRLKIIKTSTIPRHIMHDLTKRILHAESLLEVSSLFTLNKTIYLYSCYIQQGYYFSTSGISVDLAFSRIGVHLTLNERSQWSFLWNDVACGDSSEDCCFWNLAWLRSSLLMVGDILFEAPISDQLLDEGFKGPTIINTVAYILMLLTVLVDVALCEGVFN